MARCGCTPGQKGAQCLVTRSLPGRRTARSTPSQRGCAVRARHPARAATRRSRSSVRQSPARTRTAQRGGGRSCGARTRHGAPRSGHPPCCCPSMPYRRNAAE
eukprot:scaffold146_cov374-Prasinococcus_capsulatus_cf.AAC.6